ncbi:MAG: UDP-N-acetylglucosamine 2-epimerase (non-hydrolyzing) [Deltaproteobacteria bacterium]|nr:UDP-N-acetylglucosamine 2-epimerase (non-hydrolyzing) [Deltaproteobacteria bacterium]
MKIKIINVVGARPNFMKIPSIMEEMEKHPDRLEPVLVHTGQHYDKSMSKVFFEDLQIPEPDINLEIGSGSHAEQTAGIMLKFEKILLTEKPDLVLVLGDVNSTLACSVTASKLSVPVAHVEAGLRSFDRTMPEEINRIVTDVLSDYLFTTCEDANENLRREGISEKKIFFVGNVMIDTLLKHRAKARRSNVLERLSLNGRPYILITLHRPSNVDSREIFFEITEALKYLAEKIPVIFPVHPRTKKQILGFGLEDTYRTFSEGMKMPDKGVWLTEPFGYLDFLNLIDNAKVVLTDSGGIQEETTVLRVPCITIRDNTERPITITEGTNVLVGTDIKRIIDEGIKALNISGKSGRIPKLWDGKAGERIVKILLENL